MRLRQVFIWAVLFGCSLLTAEIINNPIYAKPMSSMPADDTKYEQPKQNTFSVLACVTWWSHDAVGYHPAMALFLENTGGQDITGGEVPFQGRFTDVKTGEVTVAREYRRAPIRRHERVSVFFRGPAYYELPINSNLWPTIECKAMCRLNSKVEDLYMVHLTKITMSDEDAQALLVAQAGRSPLLLKNNGNKIDLCTSDSSSESRPQLHASDNSANRAKNNLNKKTTGSAKRSLPKSLPGLGSDYYDFDRLYGQAIEVQTGRGGGDLTWAHYKAHSLVKDLFVGSHNANKADMIIVVVDALLKDKDMISLLKSLANCPRGAVIPPFSHSVRYLPGGRSELMSSAIGDSKILCFLIQNEGSGDTVLVVSRLPGELEYDLSACSRRVPFLRFLGL